MCARPTDCAEKGLLGASSNRVLAERRCSGAAAATGDRHGSLQVELEGEALVGFPRKLFVGPDVSKCLIDGEGLSSAKARAEQSRAPARGAIAPLRLFVCRVGSQGT